MAVLTDDQIDAALPDLDGWEHSDGALRRSIKFPPAFLDGIDAVRRSVSTQRPRTTIPISTSAGGQ